MKSISRLLTKLIKMLLAGTFTIIVAACYGIWMDYRLLFHVSDPQKSPIPDIHLTLMDGLSVVDETWTDVNGEAYLYTYGADQSTIDKDYTITIVDEDGSDNGGDFTAISMDVTVPGDTEYGDELEYSVTMYPKN